MTEQQPSVDVYRDINHWAVVARMTENSIDQEEFGREELAKRRAERAANLAKTNGMAPEVRIGPGDIAEL